MPLRQDDLEGLNPLQNLYSTGAGHGLTLFKHHVDDDLLRDLVVYRKLLPKLGSTGAKQPLYIGFDMPNSSLLQQDLAGNVDAQRVHSCALGMAWVAHVVHLSQGLIHDSILTFRIGCQAYTTLGCWRLFFVFCLVWEHIHPGSSHLSSFAIRFRQDATAFGSGASKWL